jgi:2-oxoglutarate dehydrogenase E1 component
MKERTELQEVSGVQVMSNQAIWEKFYGPNMGYIYEAYEKYKENPNTIDPSLKTLFDEYGSPPLSDQMKSDSLKIVPEDNMKHMISAIKLLKNVRTFGHLAAKINPLHDQTSADTSRLKPETYSLDKEKLMQIPAEILWEDSPPAIHNGWDAYQYLMSIYTKTIAYEFGHIHHDEEQKWLNQNIECQSLKKPLSIKQRKDLLYRLLQVDGFEVFLHKTFVGQKRFSIEGMDMLVPMLDQVIKSSIEDKTENIMMGMAHRGRLNVLAHVLGKPYEQIFSEFHQSPNKDLVPSEGSRGINEGWSGDVKYHLGAEREIKGDKEYTIRVNLANNPSHLEFVDPVVQGMTRAAQDEQNGTGFPSQNKQSSFSVLIHGDAAFPGEGVVAETLNLSALRGFKTGGTIHIIANNQLGFTTDYEDSRSTRYSSDLAKGYEIPIIHVNADDPESCLAVIDLAYQYRKKFHKDILIDLVGYRRFGHNEMDDPQVTQPKLYKMINDHLRIAEKYATELITENVMTKEEVNHKKEEIWDGFKAEFEMINHKQEDISYPPVYKPDLIPQIDTSVSQELLQQINQNLLIWPKSLHVNPKLERILKRRTTALRDGNKVDWALAETLAFATILSDGKPIRLTGQDSERGTFAHRHLVLHDYETNERYIPLHNLPEAKATFSIYNSPLSEAAVLGFEYGYSVQSPGALVIWEAQFGDFVNAAQVILDQFISAGQAKWGQKSSLVMLLPHGYEGQGPEHSSGRWERFLRLSGENNWIVANVTSAAQYFHLLRRQAFLTDRKESRPLIIMTPKSLLRHPQSGSPEHEFSNGEFKLILEQEETGNQPERVKRLILCSGKVAIDLATSLEEIEHEHLHIARVEQMYPFPKKEVKELIERFPNLEEVVWVQEEPKNMGAWLFIQPYLMKLAPNQKISYVGRPMRSSPATGNPHIHKQEQADIIQNALNICKGGCNDE